MRREGQNQNEGLPPKEELKTLMFFDRPSDAVAPDLSERVMEKDDNKQITYSDGKAKIIRIKTQEGEKRFKVKLVEPYLEVEAMQVWKSKRLERIRSLQPGEIVCFNFRGAVLSFIKTRGGDNILLRVLEDLDTGDVISTPTAVSALLGLTHDAEAKLTYVDEESFVFGR
jgi:hypothetical protein